MGFFGLQNVQPKMTAHPGQHLKQQAKPSETIGCASLSRHAAAQKHVTEEQPCWACSYKLLIFPKLQSACDSGLTCMHH